MERQFENVRAMVTALTPSYPVYCLRPHVLLLEQLPGRGFFHLDLE